MFTRFFQWVDRYANVIPAVVTTFLTGYVLYAIGANIYPESIPYGVFGILCGHGATGFFAMIEWRVSDLARAITFAVAFVVCLVILIYSITSWPFLPVILIISVFAGVMEYLLLYPERK